MAGTRGTADAVVVGGGITGAFAAYFLARLGATVTLIEREKIGGQASGNNPGGLNPLHGAGIPGPMQDLALESYRLHLEHWDSIRDLSGIAFSAERRPRLHVAIDGSDVAGLERAKEQYDSTPGLSAEWIEPERLAETEPRLNPEAMRGLWTEGNGKVDPGPYTRAVAAAAVRLGASALTAEVRGIRHRGKRVTEVLLESESVHCDLVVIATGVWCAEPARWLDEQLPVEPVKGEMLLVDSIGGGVQTDLAWREVGVYGTSGRELWLGGTEERVGFDREPSSGARASILERTAQLLPGLGRPRVLRQTAALRPVTRDGFPIVGAAGRWENAYLALGSGRKGMLLSAGIGLAVAELATDGSIRPPIRPCSPARLSAAPAL